MTTKHINRVVDRLDRHLSNHGYSPHASSEFTSPQVCANPRLVGDHARYMIREIRHFCVEGEENRALRWLRFVEGICWSLGIVSLSEIQFIHEDVTGFGPNVEDYL